jgi:hypothetical protein
MVRFVEDLPPAKKALATTPSRIDRVLLVECDRSPYGHDAATNAMEQQDCGAMHIPVGDLKGEVLCFLGFVTLPAFNRGEFSGQHVNRHAV